MSARVVITRELRQILGLLYRLLDVRITFFDIQQAEHTSFDMKPMSAYCAARRRNRAFDRRCVGCDREHLVTAKRLKDVHIYRCHNGLLEGIVPLYDRRNIYIGAIVFGQLRDPGSAPPADARPRERALFARLPACPQERVADIGLLLKCVSEYIIGNELVRGRNPVWAERLESHIEENLAASISLDGLAAAIGRSRSFVSHHFRTEFGRSPKQYVQKRRMEEARVMLEAGESVKGAAARLGFHDAFHFSKAFKAHWGRPPSTFCHR